MRRFAENADCEVVVLREIGGLPEILADFTAKGLRRAGWLGRALGAALQSLCGRFVATKLGRRISDATAEQFPAGYFMVARKR